MASEHIRRTLRARAFALRAVLGGGDPLMRAARIALFACVLAACYVWQDFHQRLLQTPRVRSLESFSFLLTLDRNDVTIGRADLGQATGPMAAEDRHLRFVLASRNQVLVGNAAQHLRLGLNYSGAEIDAERFRLTPGRTSRLYFGDGDTITFTHIDLAGFNMELRAAHAAHPFASYSYTGTLARSDGGTWDAGCDRGRIESFELGGRDGTVAFIGGRYSCSHPMGAQIGGFAALPGNTFRIVRAGPEFFVAPFDPHRRFDVPAAFATSSGPDSVPDERRAVQGYGNMLWPVSAPAGLGTLSSLVIGRTTYDLATSPERGGMRVTLKPVKSTALIFDTQCLDPKERSNCPHPFDGHGSAAPGARPPQWSSLYDPLERGSGAAALSSTTGFLNRYEQGARLGAGLLAVLIAFFTGVPLAWASRRLKNLVRRVRRHPASPETRDPTPGHAPDFRPFALTLLSVAIALLPDLLLLAGISLGSLTALRLLLLNWVFAAFVLLRDRAGLVLGLLWLAVTVMAALGAILLAAAAIDGDNLHWVSFYAKQKFLFLDFVPPFAIAVASPRADDIRRVLQTYVMGEGPVAKIMRWGPAALLVTLSVVWMLVGSQTGFGVFQPVELAKFAVVFIAANVFMLFDDRVRLTPLWKKAFPTLLSFGAIALLTGLLLLAPFFRSDWSPMLIMGALLLGMVVIFGWDLALTTYSAERDRRRARIDRPVTFLPKLNPRQRTRFLLRRFGLLVLLALPILSMIVWTPIGSTLARLSGMPHWTSDSVERLKLLEDNGLIEGRLVAVERFISWTDAGFARGAIANCSLTPKSDAAPRACYSDIENQVIRSRRVIADAACGIDTPSRRALWRIAAERPLSVCDPVAKADPRKMPQPIGIPEAESDFAAAYAIGTLGFWAVYLLYAAQALFVAIVVYGMYRLSAWQDGGVVHNALRRFTLLVMTGAALLYVLQWLLSWSNALGLLPVMGQPMTWLSYAPSHHLFMALPCLVLIVIALRIVRVGPQFYRPRDIPVSD